ncbi:MAG: DMT family transporter [Pseudomonadota bacterium]
MDSKTNFIVKVAPAVFVLLWATGFVGAKFGTSDADPITFLAIRFAITFAILVPLVVVFVRPNISFNQQIVHSMLIGCLIQAVYLGGVFYAIDRGMAAGISSLVVALQPFFTAIFALFLMGERLPFSKVLCFFAALGGVVLVLFPDLKFVSANPGIRLETVAAALLGTIAISVGAVYQKRYVTDLNLWVATTAQFAGAAVLAGLYAVLFEDLHIVWSTPVVFSMLWLIFVLSIGAVGLLMYLIRKDSTSSVASLFFLVPVVALFMSWILFGEDLVAMQLLGSAIVVCSVGIVTRLK